MYDHLPSFILGFHGCDHALAEEVFAGKTTLKSSDNAYDWLGHGVYFWENNPKRALDYARLLKAHPSRSRGLVNEPAVVGAVIDLGLCLNLLDAQFIATVRDAYGYLAALHKQAGTDLPLNSTAEGSNDLLLRNLDCAVIEALHQIRDDQGLTSFDSARGVFVEGSPIYPGAGIHEFNHIQVCVRNPRCIKGYFRVREEPLSAGD